MLYKRKSAFAFAVCAILLYSLFSISCDNAGGEKAIHVETYGFTVKYLDVGDGDATVIRFPDGTITLIDCAEESAAYFSSVKSALNGLGATKIDNLIITHLHSTAAGNAAALFSEYEVERVFLPFVHERITNALYDSIKQAAGNDTELVASEYGRVIGGADCFIAFLYPTPYGEPDSPYNEFNLEYYPSDDMTDDCSSITLLNYKGVKFMFTGDATASAERKVINYYSSNSYDNMFAGFDVGLSRVDFFKVPRRGGDGACSSEFLNFIKPRRAVISVSGLNNYGCPSSAVLQRISEIGDTEILRTDTHGDIEVKVADNGEISVKTNV